MLLKTISWHLDYFQKLFSRHKKETIVLLTILILAVVFRFYKLEKLFSFDWDQERDAQVIWRILIEHRPTLIGPRAVGPDAFFLGPLWYYMLLPFYFLFNMDPVGAAVFTAISGVVTTFVVFMVFRRLFGFREATIGCFLWALQLERVAWNPILVPLISLVELYFVLEIARGKSKFIPLAFLVAGLGLHVHFQTIFLFLLIFISLYFNYKKTLVMPIKAILMGFIMLFLTFTPLLLFDLKHEFINAKSFLSFFSTSQMSQFQLGEIYWRFDMAFSTFIRYVNGFLPEISSLSLPSGLVVLIFSTLGIISGKIDKSSKVILLMAIFLPSLVFSFYKGILSEYYFILSIVPILVGICLLFGKIYSGHKLGKIAVIVLLVAIFVIRTKNLFMVEHVTSLYHKKQAVQFIINQKQDLIFNTSYSAPFNGDAGFRYLFKFYGREPQDIPEGHLWTIVVPAYGEDIPPMAQFGDIGVIRR